MNTRRVAQPTGLALAGPVALLVIAWASTFAAIKVGLDHCPPLLFAGLRAMLAGAAMTPVAWRSGTPVRLGSAWPTYLVLAMLNVVLALASALAWALGTIYLKRSQHLVAQQWAVTGQFLVGGVVLTGLGLLVEEPGSVSWTPMFWVGLGYAGVVGSALAWALWVWLVRTGEASRAAAFIFFVPLGAIVIGAVLFDESVTPLLSAGAALVVAGIYLANRRQPEH